MKSRRAALVATVTLVGALPGVGTALSAQAAGPGPAQLGAYGPLFEEPGTLAGDADCTAADGKPNCKPAAMAVAQLANGKLVYWDGLEGMNRVKFDVVAEFGDVAENDQSRVMTLGAAGPQWVVPKNPRADFGKTDENDDLPGVPINNSPGNDSDLFCSSLVQLANGDVLAAGGTGYYQEPGVPGTPYGVTELEGLRLSRVFNAATNTWTRTGDMHEGRWYPSLVTEPNGHVFVASGVTKLLKPVYPDAPLSSGTNVKQTETYTPGSGKWALNPTSADKSLPLFPRLHLLPDGHIYYDAAGQTFNPAGQSYDEALWNLAAVFDPSTNTWKNLGVPTIDGLPLGFRGSGFSVMLPLVPDANGRYTKASFLSAGGVIGVSPGTYAATNSSTLNTIDTANGDALTSAATGNLNNSRWYSTGVVLPTGQVFAVNGASADEVVGPGSAFPVTQAELYDPDTKTWSVAQTETHGRTYHNTAILLPDGRVLVGGHAPIATGYQFQTDAGASAIGLSKAESDPTFQIYSPPYLFRGARPVITGASPQVAYGSTYTVATPQAANIASVALVRNPSLTHLVDSDQRTVDLRIVSRTPGSITVAVPGPAVLPPGPYMLFVNEKTSQGLVPSVSRQTFVGTPVPPFAAAALKNGQPTTTVSGSAIARSLTGNQAPADQPAQLSAVRAKASGRQTQSVGAMSASMPANTRTGVDFPAPQVPGRSRARSLAPVSALAAAALMAMAALQVRAFRRRNART